MSTVDVPVAAVTGGASGIGEATVRLLVQRGWSVVVGDLQARRLQALEADLGPSCRGLRVDVAEEDDVRGLIDTALGEFGRLDLMFNNAGMLGAVGSITQLRREEIQETMDVDLLAVILGTKHAARVMIPQGSGSIVSTTSPAGVAGGHGPHVYSATKAAVIGLTQSVAAELRPHGVRVNAVMPGGTVTAMTATLTVEDADDLEGATRAMSADALLGRPITPEAIAHAVAFLAGPDSAFVTGETLRVDAGMTTAPGRSPFATGRFAAPGSLGPPGDRR